MENQELAERLADRIALDVYTSLEHSLQMLPPNGAHIHRRGNLTSFFLEG
jgi:hypothetical protein|tara:strand:- start:104 stop:253 length:150 start_codon:yes stop_codon:yes gene_type:complete